MTRLRQWAKLLAPERARGFDEVLGINSRNDRIAYENARPAIRLVNDKYATKQALAAQGAPVAPTLAVLRSRTEMRSFDWSGLPDTWALKPNQSLGGNGILLAFGRRSPTTWHTGSGKDITLLEVKDHLRFIIDGEYSGRSRDAGLVEPLIRSHPDLERVTYRGLPDIRVICVGDEPRLAMMRLPTSQSGGRANLHQNAVGAAVDLATGCVEQAWAGNRSLTHHPDTGAPLLGARVPFWEQVLDAAARCSRATGLRYLGADVVVDADRGPLILEVNARPGLQIQNVTGLGLVGAIGPTRPVAASRPVTT